MLWCITDVTRWKISKWLLTLQEARRKQRLLLYLQLWHHSCQRRDQKVSDFNIELISYRFHQFIYKGDRVIWARRRTGDGQWRTYLIRGERRANRNTKWWRNWICWLCGAWRGYLLWRRYYCFWRFLAVSVKVKKNTTVRIVMRLSLFTPPVVEKPNISAEVLQKGDRVELFINESTGWRRGTLYVYYQGTNTWSVDFDNGINDEHIYQENCWRWASSVERAPHKLCWNLSKSKDLCSYLIFKKFWEGHRLSIGRTG